MVPPYVGSMYVSNWTAKFQSGAFICETWGEGVSILVSSQIAASTLEFLLIDCALLPCVFGSASWSYVPKNSSEYPALEDSLRGVLNGAWSGDPFVLLKDFGWAMTVRPEGAWLVWTWVMFCYLTSVQTSLLIINISSWSSLCSYLNFKAKIVCVSSLGQKFVLFCTAEGDKKWLQVGWCLSWW